MPLGHAKQALGGTEDPSIDNHHSGAIGIVSHHLEAILGDATAFMSTCNFKALRWGEDLLWFIWQVQ